MEKCKTEESLETIAMNERGITYLGLEKGGIKKQIRKNKRKARRAKDIHEKADYSMKAVRGYLEIGKAEKSLKYAVLKTKGEVKEYCILEYYRFFQDVLDFKKRARNLNIVTCFEDKRRYGKDAERVVLDEMYRACDLIEQSNKDMAEFLRGTTYEMTGRTREAYDKYLDVSASKKESTWRERSRSKIQESIISERL